ncbi:serine hydrolase domain-containing protein [Glycomyces tenuis]|uniref:serine hydrolase domain-containing protein n=1 Tax=Glycomyces tenuis TaxID=58116 RepID=UPI00042065E0|nr:serine hydrolase domain-containing protein [Glycomyces tenuis]
MPAIQAAPRRKASGVATRIGAAFGVAAILATTAACGQTDPELPEPPSGDGAAPEELTQANVDAWLDETLPEELERNGIAGAVVSVVNDSAVLTNRGFGYADTGEDGSEPVEADPEDTLFRVASVSKVFTATAVMQLVEQGELDLDADVSEYIDFELEREYDDDITLRHLLTHTAGFEERIFGLIAYGDDPVDLRAVLATDPPEQVYRPGTTPSYSNYGNALAGYIVQRVSGETFEEYTENHIFEPLGMDSSTFRQPLPDHLSDRVSNGYLDGSGPAREFEMVGTPPAGSLSISANDMSQFMLAQLGSLPEQSLLLSDETREQMYTPALTEESLGAFAESERMTLGWFQEDRGGHRIVGHGGDSNFFHSHLQLYPDDGTGIFISLNSSGSEGADTVALRADFMDEFTDRYFPADAESAETVDEAAMKENAERIAGTYVTSRGFQSTFMSALDLLMNTEITALDDGRLYFEADPGTGKPGVYEQIDEFTWREVGGDRTIAVRMENGEVTGIVHDAAFTLLPLDIDRAIGLPLLIGAAALLVLGLLAWPAGAIHRRLRKRPAPEREGRLMRVLVRVGAACTVLAIAGWVAIVVAIMGLTDPPAAAIRAVQALQLIGALGMAPAVVKLVGEIRRKSGWKPITGTVLTLLALSAVANFAIEFQLLSPNISY